MCTCPNSVLWRTCSVVGLHIYRLLLQALAVRYMYFTFVLLFFTLPYSIMLLCSCLLLVESGGSNNSDTKSIFNVSNTRVMMTAMVKSILFTPRLHTAWSTSKPARHVDPSMDPDWYNNYLREHSTMEQPRLLLQHRHLKRGLVSYRIKAAVTVYAEVPTCMDQSVPFAHQAAVHASYALCMSVACSWYGRKALVYTSGLGHSSQRYSAVRQHWDSKCYKTQT